MGFCWRWWDSCGVINDGVEKEVTPTISVGVNEEHFALIIPTRLYVNME